MVVMERGAASPSLIIMLLVTAVIFMYLAADGVVMGDGFCVGGEISDDGTHSAYVAHVLSELETVTPTTSTLTDTTKFPGNGASGSVVGMASCSDPNDPDLCASCLLGLQQLLSGSCSTRAGGYANSDACAMAFGTPST
ncbi:unnamed protein product [Linum tenue]|uniref:Gnk2-homologous domain-containing protein n=1 Tax=Linum tenue TaxID=586396 RepID=A0AAV0JLI9_9ROSI|nr:unnamed protein product [Linum tenue]